MQKYYGRGLDFSSDFFPLKIRKSEVKIKENQVPIFERILLFWKTAHFVYKVFVNLRLTFYRFFCVQKERLEALFGQRRRPVQDGQV